MSRILTALDCEVRVASGSRRVVGRFLPPSGSSILLPILHCRTGYWPFGLIVCDAWQVSDVVMGTSSIMHMCTISMDRYAGIRDPLRRRVEQRAPIGLRIGAVWLVSIAFGSPLVALGFLWPEQVLDADLQCAIFNEYFLIYGSLAAFFGPLGVISLRFA